MISYTWLELREMNEEFLTHPDNAKYFTVVDHPEFPTMSKMDPVEVLEVLTELLEAEGRDVHLKNLYAYAPIYEYAIARSNSPIL